MLYRHHQFFFPSLCSGHSLLQTGNLHAGNTYMQGIRYRNHFWYRGTRSLSVFMKSSDDLAARPKSNSGSFWGGECQLRGMFGDPPCSDFSSLYLNHTKKTSSADRLFHRKNTPHDDWFWKVISKVSQLLDDANWWNLHLLMQ